jgi:hypothetical protein
MRRLDENARFCANEEPACSDINMRRALFPDLIRTRGQLKSPDLLIAAQDAIAASSGDRSGG